MNATTHLEIWKRKLAAYLHDPPSKCLDLRTHGERADAAFRQAGFTDTEIGDYFRDADHTGAAADRFPFPNSLAAGLQCHFDGVRNAFRHPLDGTHTLPFHKEFVAVEQAFEGENSIQPALKHWPQDWTGDNEWLLWRARFFAHWRLWPQFAREKDYRLGLLPADTRLPDHTIWTHMQVVSALAGCVGRNRVWQPAFLKFQLGPVQEFIAQARSTRDLWSGSYLLSWLMAVGLKALSAEIGPDAVIFPNLRGQPIFDLLWKAELWDVIRIGDQPSWDSVEPKQKDEDIRTPNLPNVFLALVPAGRAPELAKLVAEAIQQELKRIAASVWDACTDAGLTDNPEDVAFQRTDRKRRFDQQIARFLSLSWQITPWPETIKETLQWTEALPPVTSGKTLRDRVEAIIRAATQQMHLDHRDERFYTDSSKTELNNVGVTWALLVALNAWQLDAVRQTRAFPAWSDGGWQVGTASNKDSLTGREEAVAGGRHWFERCGQLAGRPPTSQPSPQHETLARRFKHDDWLGAMTLVKRLWDLTYLLPKFGLRPLPMPNTRGIAAHEPFRDDTGDQAKDEPEEDRYFAVLALDGDQMGQWIAGDKSPRLETQLADYRDHADNPLGARAYFERQLPDLLQLRRPVSPSYHLQFSECLSNFALFCVRPIVETFDGRLIYAGGDDVLALFPADTALDCARALRMAFRGDPELKDFLQRNARRLQARHQEAQQRDPKAAPAPYYQTLAANGCLLDTPRHQPSGHPGFLCRLDLVDQQQKPIPFAVPGPAADCSVGIAVAHYKHPLQDVVREAQAAEKRAKKELGRSALAVTLLKRSGETIQWGCPWDSGGLEAFQAIVDALADGAVSHRFPYRVIELLEPYRTETSPLASKSLEPARGFPSVEIALRELQHVLNRQGQDKESPSYQNLAQLVGSPSDRTDARTIGGYLNHARQWAATRSAQKLAEAPIEALIGLCQTAAFIARNLPAPRSGTSDLESETQPAAERQPVTS